MKLNSLSIKLDSLNLNDPYSMESKQKNDFLFRAMKDLYQFHYKNCVGYKRFADMFKDLHYSLDSLEGIPPLPVRMFKLHDLVSLDKNLIFKTLHSSGTSGQSVSKIYLDASSAKRQTKILSSITKNFIGNSRLPMIIIDSDDLFKDRTKLNARAAGILGYSVFGRNHFYCLDSNLHLLAEELSQFLKKHNNGPILIFGFTFIIWQSLLQFAIKNNIKFNFGRQSILIHGGGWKKLEDHKVSNEDFKKQLKEYLGINHIHNYYGMVEQVGSVFMECDHGYLHSPDYSDIIIRNPLNNLPMAHKEEGVIQVISILPISYPGHSLLTEDLGTIHGEDDCKCGRKGKYFSVSGRLPMAELRGCSDTRTVIT